MSRELIAKKLKELRDQSGLTADEVGALIGKSGKTVNAWENNRGQPDAEILIQLSDIYHIDNILAAFRPEGSDALSDLKTLETKYRSLNQKGQEKLIDYADDLVCSGKYAR